MLSPATLPPGKRLGTHCIEGRASLDGCRNLSQHHTHNKINSGHAILLSSYMFWLCRVILRGNNISGSYYSWKMIVSLNLQICYTLFKKLSIVYIFSLQWEYPCVINIIINTGWPRVISTKNVSLVFMGIFRFEPVDTGMNQWHLFFLIHLLHDHLGSCTSNILQ